MSGAETHDPTPDPDALAAGSETLARAVLEARGFDLADAPEWEPITGTGYRTGSVAAPAATVSADLEGVGVLLERADLGEPEVSVGYGTGGVSVFVDVEPTAGGHAGVSVLDMTPEAARELAAALASAAEEYDRRPVAADEPGIAARSVE